MNYVIMSTDEIETEVTPQMAMEAAFSVAREELSDLLHGKTSPVSPS